MLSCFDFIRDSTLAAMLLRLLLAFVCGGVIGAEREFKRRPAGFRTHILICLGAAVTALTSQYLFLERGLYTDVGRLGAQVIAGIGFIGAGTIIVTGRKQVKGLTTAAGLWASACLGLAIGAGFYECALASMAMIFVCMYVLPATERLIIARSRYMNILAELDRFEHCGGGANRLREEGVRVHDVDINKEKDSHTAQLSVRLSVYLPKKYNHMELLAKLSTLAGVVSIEEVQ